jgi:thiamine kinase-like enzyme
MVRLIPKIAKKINEILKKRGLFPLESPENFIKRTYGRKHRYSSVCQDKKGRKFIFYARLHDSPVERERMITEVKLARVLMKKRYDFFSRYFDGKIEKDFEWVLREFFEEDPIEDKKNIEKLRRKISREEILRICQVLLKFQKIKISDFQFLKKFDLKKYSKLPEQIEKERIFSGEEVKKLKKFLKENFKILREENKYFCHGDFQIGNIILFNNKKIKIIDLESAKISNFAFDVCFLWARLWRERKIAKEILKNFYEILSKRKRKRFEILFRLNSFFIGFHSFVQKPREYDRKMIKKRREFFLNVLKKSLESFEELKKL